MQKDNKQNSTKSMKAPTSEKGYNENSSGENKVKKRVVKRKKKKEQPKIPTGVKKFEQDQSEDKSLEKEE